MNYLSILCTAGCTEPKRQQAAAFQSAMHKLTKSLDCVQPAAAFRQIALLSDIYI